VWSDPNPSVLDTSASVAVGYQPAVTYAAATPKLVEAALSETAGRDWRDVYPRFASYATGMVDYAAEDDLVNRLRTRLVPKGADGSPNVQRSPLPRHGGRA
jgi:hypothetical protein